MQRNQPVPPDSRIIRLALKAIRTTGNTAWALCSTRSTLLSLLLCCWWLPLVPTEAAANAIDPQTAFEVDRLLEYIETSPCRFNRNGDWHEAAAAAEHIDSKYRYLLNRDRIDSTEDFIRQAATASSISGRAYLVQCRGGETLTTAHWLTGILAELRRREFP